MIWLLEISSSLHLDKALFKLEHDANATSIFATWLVAGFPVPFASVWVTLCYAVPVYYLSGMRQDGFEYFLKYLLATSVGVIYNMYLHQLCVVLTHNMKWSIVLFPSFAVFFQIFFSGYAVTAITMKGWYRWGVQINIAKWVLCCLFQNQYRGNQKALGYPDFDDAAEQFHWSTPYWLSLLNAIYLTIETKIIVFIVMHIKVYVSDKLSAMQRSK